MPLFIDTSRIVKDGDASVIWPRHRTALRLVERSIRCVTIGLVNNMPDSAFRATERQFVSLLEGASDGIPVRFVLYAMPGIRREGATLHHAESFYSSVETLGEVPLDGLIVTGREPVTADLRAEAYWESFTRVLGWARENTYSTVWSCLAAHAAILHMDGIERRKSEHKHFGVLECTRESGHPLLTGTPPRFRVPHSRWNGVAAEELESRGYTVLARSKAAGVDTFVKQDGSLFVFFQGHPEYEADTLLREYRRDVARYLCGESHNYPLVPVGYFNQTTADALTALREKALNRRDKRLLERVSAVLEKPEIENTWRTTAALVYRNWLEYIRSCKQEGQTDRVLIA
jgi:homoserine O-succinyltransferase